MLSQPMKINIRTISAGKLGHLSVVEASRDLPFPIRRIYYIHGARAEARRGFHAHKTLYQLMVAMHGRVDLHLEGPAGVFSFELSSPEEGVLVPPGYWREMQGMGPETVLMVLASSDYDEADYIRDYDHYKQWLDDLDVVARVPYLNLPRPQNLAKELELAAGEVIRSGLYINGPKVKRFEQQFAELCQVDHVVGVGNGLDALTLILRALKIGAGDEVIVCAAGFAATALAVSRVGASPVFVDCLPDGNLDPVLIEPAVTEKTRAVIPTHLYGFPAEMTAISATAAKFGLKVIEDACQAHGASLQGRPCGCLGQAAAFSFYPTKNLGAFGDAGCVATDDAGLAEQVRLLANYGSGKKYQHLEKGWNSRLDELQAALLSAQLPYLASHNEARRNFAATYDQSLRGLPGLELPEFPARSQPVWHVYAVRVKNGKRDELAGFLADQGIGTNIHYPVPIHKQPCYLREYETASFPEAESWAAETLSLPLDYRHQQAEINQVCKMVRKFFQ